jgi:dimethylamine/trimethylamine dehydrogenase
MRNPRFDILFEPVGIGPVIAPNRFYQTPHATGMGWRHPKASAALRGIKAEGGWGVVCTEYCSIHPSSDDHPFGYLSLWDEDDVRAMAKIADAVHIHQSLLGVELWHGGFHTNNRLTREPALSPSGQRLKYGGPGSARAMDTEDVKAFLGWQGAAAARARRAGADIVYVYAGHDYLPFQFLSPRTNRRDDQYGGSVKNRARFLADMIEVTRQAVAGRCAVAVRLAIDELHGKQGLQHDGEGAELLSLVAELPDLWDINVAGSLGNDSKSSRFAPEGFQEEFVAGVKRLTTKPVVGVGRFTSPDTMVSQVRRGILDFIGAARPSIADPFLPAKIREGREDDIRECIGCNICRSANNEASPIRCTQNPAMGEEWRRGWHPERIAPRASDKSILVVGAGPAGLEAALSLGRRGYKVMLADRARELGGRLLVEKRLPGLQQAIRVRDYREYQLSKLASVEVFRESDMTVEAICEAGAGHVVLATGSIWRKDAIGVVRETPLVFGSDVPLTTPDDLGQLRDPVVIYDDDHYAMGGALAEQLKLAGHDVTYVTSSAIVSAWTQLTDEQAFIEQRLVELGIPIRVSHVLAGADAAEAWFGFALSQEQVKLPIGTLLLVTGRVPRDELYKPLVEALGQDRVSRIGDCLTPSHIADAVYAGHKFARAFDETPGEVTLRERPLP